ncbi:MAG: hypothetical protein KKD99_05095, partial [Proteobacteria bacterium]|nr:hypothetical protein [Pseudomonadota bacterium]
EAEMLGRVGQIKSLGYDSANKNWFVIKPDGSTPTFTLRTGESFIMTEIRVRFYVTDTSTETGPYRFYLLGPQSSRLYVATLTDAMYPNSTTVYGGVISEVNLNPGYIFSILPTAKVQQLPPPPAPPNSGTERSGTFYLTIRGYVVP